MTTFLLIRHAERDESSGMLPGRSAGVPLTEGGRAQAERLAERLTHLPIVAIYSSPLERALETAAPLARQLGLAPVISPALTEIDFGRWTNRPPAELDASPLWRQFNSFRSGTRAPDGESMLEVQLRMVREIERLLGLHSGATVALVSHGDPIKSALMYFLGMPIDFFLRLEIGFASVSELAIDDEGARILRVNDTGP